MTKKIPVGATFEFVAPDGIGIRSGAVGRIWLQARSPCNSEVWRWEWSYKDGSGREEDWTPSRRKAVEECGIRFGGCCPVRFRAKVGGPTHAQA